MAKSRISANDFLSLIKDENEHIKRDIGRQSYLGQRPNQENQKTPTLELRTELLGVPPTPTGKPKTEHEAISEQAQKTNIISNKPSAKRAANDPQTGSKGVAKRAANDPQTGSKGVARFNSESTVATHLENKRVAKRVADQLANDPQTGSKEVAEAHFDALVGKERTLVLFLANNCRLNGSLVTSPITRERVAELIESSTNRAKNIIFRLQEKSIIESFESKTGRGGWTKFKIEKAIFQKALIQLSGSKHTPNDLQTGSKHTPNRVAERVAEPPIVVVSPNSINTINTGTSDEPCFVIPAELNGKVSRRQLLEFVTSGKTTESDLQLSLDAFAYDLRHKLVSLKHSSNPIGLLIGAIKNNGSYNSAKYIEALKSELKPLIQDQRDALAEKISLKGSAEWASFQKFKLESPEDYKQLESKVARFGLSGVMLEEFTFLEFKKVILKTDEEPLNSLGAPMSTSP